MDEIREEGAADHVGPCGTVGGCGKSTDLTE